MQNPHYKAKATRWICACGDWDPIAVCHDTRDMLVMTSEQRKPSKLLFFPFVWQIRAVKFYLNFTKTNKLRPKPENHRIATAAVSHYA